MQRAQLRSHDFSQQVFPDLTPFRALELLGQQKAARILLNRRIVAAGVSRAKLRALRFDIVDVVADFLLAEPVAAVQVVAMKQQGLEAPCQQRHVIGSHEARRRSRRNRPFRLLNRPVARVELSNRPVKIRRQPPRCHLRFKSVGRVQCDASGRLGEAAQLDQARRVAANEKVAPSSHGQVWHLASGPARRAIRTAGRVVCGGELLTEVLL